MAKERYWLGSTTCDLCGKKNPPELIDAIVDGLIGSGMRGSGWALTCSDCWATYGRGKLGVGRGQKYTKQDDDRYLKTEG